MLIIQGRVPFSAVANVMGIFGNVGVSLDFVDSIGRNGGASAGHRVMMIGRTL